MAGSTSNDDATLGPEEEPDTSFDPSELSPASAWRQISEGGYSEVYKAHLLGASVAVKQATSRKKTSGEALLREIRYLRLAGPHPNIVQPYGAFSERGKLHLVMEFARHSLRSDRVARSADPLIVLSGVARALVRLHGLGIIHRDLKARNVLVAENNRALLIDFGLACHLQLDSSEWIGRTVGTKKYRPPEMRESRAALPSMDVYCFGQMAEKLLRQRERTSSEGSPRSDDSGHERKATRVLQDVAQQCTRRDPTERPSAWKLLQRLMRHCGDEPQRCDSHRERVALSTMPQEPSQPVPPGDGGGRRKRARAGASGGDASRSGSPPRHRQRERSTAVSRSL